MKILLFIRSLDVGGTQRQLAVLAAGLAKRSHDISIAVFYAGGKYELNLEGTGVQILDLRKSSRWHVIGPMWRLLRLLRKERYDILYSFLPTENSVACMIAPFASHSCLVIGARAVGMRAVGYDYLVEFIYRLEVWLSSRAKIIISNSAAGRLDAIKHGAPADRIVVVSNGVDSEQIKPNRALGRSLRRDWKLSDEHFVIGMVARLDPMKDHESFLKAAALFVRVQPNTRFVCVGGGAAHYREKLEHFARSMGLGDVLVWTGEIDDARLVHNAFDIATLSSIAEGFSNSVCEAMACGVPVVATDIGDNAAIVGKFGEIVPPHRPDLLCAAWSTLRQRLLDEPSLGDGARHHIIANYSLDGMIERTERIFVEIHDGRTGVDVARAFN